MLARQEYQATVNQWWQHNSRTQTKLEEIKHKHFYKYYIKWDRYIKPAKQMKDNSRPSCVNTSACSQIKQFLSYGDHH